MSGPFGFRDWQRYSGWDSPLLADSVGVNRNGTFRYGPFDVRQWQRIAGQLSPQTSMNVSFIWWADPSTTVQIAQRTLGLDSNITYPAAFSFANLGPFVTIDLFGTGAWVDNTAIFATDRPSPIDLIPPLAMLIMATAVPLPASGSVDLWCGGYYTGPAHIWVYSSVAASALLYARRSPGVDAYVDDWQNPGLVANTDLRADVILPPAATRLHVNNQTAVAGQVWCGLTPDFIGG